MCRQPSFVSQISSQVAATQRLQNALGMVDAGLAILAEEGVARWLKLVAGFYKPKWLFPKIGDSIIP